MDRLKLRNAELESRAAEADRVAGLLGFRKRNDQVPMIAARVIGASPVIQGAGSFIDPRHTRRRRRGHGRDHARRRRGQSDRRLFRDIAGPID